MPAETASKGSWFNAAIYGTVSLGGFVTAAAVPDLAVLLALVAIVFLVLALRQAWTA